MILEFFDKYTFEAATTVNQSTKILKLEEDRDTQVDIIFKDSMLSPETSKK